jgi:hypothetical protein
MDRGFASATGKVENLKPGCETGKIGASDRIRTGDIQNHNLAL